jgi:hypothetical protein
MRSNRLNRRQHGFTFPESLELPMPWEQDDGLQMS